MEPEQPQPGPEATDWLLPPESSATDADSAAAPRSADRRNVLTSLGLLAAGTAIGAVTVLAVTHDDHDSAFAGNQLPAATAGGHPGMAGGAQQPVGPPPAGHSGGGVSGEQQVQGTLTTVHASSIVVRSPSGTATYAVDDSTQILRDGVLATLDDLKTGDPVLLHVYPSGAGDELLVERIFAGAMPPMGH